MRKHETKERAYYRSLAMSKEWETSYIEPVIAVAVILAMLFIMVYFTAAAEVKEEEMLRRRGVLAPVSVREAHSDILTRLERMETLLKEVRHGYQKD